MFLCNIATCSLLLTCFRCFASCIVALRDYWVSLTPLHPTSMFGKICWWKFLGVSTICPGVKTRNEEERGLGCLWWTFWKIGIVYLFSYVLQVCGTCKYFVVTWRMLCDMFLLMVLIGNGWEGVRMLCMLGWRVGIRDSAVVSLRSYMVLCELLF